jgi:hypothetical protein
MMGGGLFDSLIDICRRTLGASGKAALRKYWHSGERIGWRSGI